MVCNTASLLHALARTSTCGATSSRSLSRRAMRARSASAEASWACFLHSIFIWYSTCACAVINDESKLACWVQALVEEGPYRWLCLTPAMHEPPQKVKVRHHDEAGSVSPTPYPFLFHNAHTLLAHTLYACLSSIPLAQTASIMQKQRLKHQPPQC